MAASGERVAWLRLLGGFRLELAGAPVGLPVNGQRLLAFLSIRGSAPRPVIAGTLWPDVSEHNAHGSLRTTVWRLHRSGARLVDAVGESLALRPEVTVDIQVFSAAAKTALHSPAASEIEVDLRAAAEEAELLPGWYDDWVIFERERLRKLRLHALEALAQRLAEQGRYAAGLDTAMDAIRIEPLRESVHRIAIAIHLAEGNVVEALRHFRFVRELLRTELGVEPSAQLVAMLPAELQSRDGVVPAVVTRPDTRW